MTLSPTLMARASAALLTGALLAAASAIPATASDPAPEDSNLLTNASFEEGEAATDAP